MMSRICGCISGSPPLSEMVVTLRAARMTASSDFSESSVFALGCAEL